MLNRQHSPKRGILLLLMALVLVFTTLATRQMAIFGGLELIPEAEPSQDLSSQLRLNWELAGIESALASGFLSVADTLSGNLLESDRLSPELRLRLLNHRLRITLLRGRLAEATTVLQAIGEQGAEADVLLEAYYHFFSGNGLEVELKLATLDPSGMEPDGLAWYRLLEALILSRSGETDAANSAFRLAGQAAPNNLVRDQFEIIRFRESLSRGQVDEVMISALRESERSMQGERAGFEAARLLAVALNQRGDSNGAIEVLNSQLGKPGLREFGLRTEFLLLVGTIAGPDSTRGRLALKEVILEGPRLEHQSFALTLLTEAVKGPQDRDEFLAELQNWLSLPASHPLEDRFLAFRAYFLAEMGNFEEAGESSRTLLDRFPSSDFVANALRMLAYTSWHQNPPRYRTAANYLNQLRQRFPQTEDSFEAGVLIADCYYLNGDFTNASDMYGAMLREASGDTAAKLFYQRVLSEIGAGRDPEAMSLIDQFRTSGLVDDETLWRAEWNLLDHLRQEGRMDEAFIRVREILEVDRRGISTALELRFRWLEARLTLEAGPVAEAVTMATRLLEEIGQGMEGISPELGSVVASHLLLLKGEAEIANDQREAGLATFARLRQAYPDSGPTILSFLVESRSEAAGDNLVNAQQSLIAIVDQFPFSEYAPIALWEAALNSEQRGLNVHLQEAISILERLVTAYPRHELVYYARLKQGDLARRLNDFPTALLLYERLLSQYQDHPERYRAELSRADCLMALGSEDSDRFDRAAVIYERNCLLPTAPLPVRIESGFKWAHSLRQQNDLPGAEAVYWLLYDRFVQDEDLSRTIVHSDAGRYWLARVLLELGSTQVNRGEIATAVQLYETLLQMNLPGRALARARLDALRQPG